jgi:hypothetical protein
MAEGIPGYTYGTAEVARSPVSVDDLEQLKQTMQFSDEDHEYLRMVGEVLSDQTDALFEHWMSLFGPIFMSYFAGPDGEPDEQYLGAAHPRFVQWIFDTCTRPYDQEWLDYQHEIGLRHHRTKKNQTDHVDSVPVVHFRYLWAVVYPMSAIRPFLAKKGHGNEEVDKMHQAWTKALMLSVILWSHPYVRDGDW